MPTIALKAHYDGRRIVLDEPYELPIDSPLIVTLLPAEGDPQIQERADWTAAAVESLNRAYGDNEPDYTDADIIEKP
jgi:hypothetical protein